jgi:hypothetical protein
MKKLSSSLDINSTDFTFSAYLISRGGTDKDGHIIVELIDDDNVPILGLAWCMDYWNDCQSGPGQERAGGTGTICAYADGKWFYCGGYGNPFPTISGKLTIKKSNGQITLHYNDGPALGSFTLTTPKIITKVGVKMAKYGGLTARDMGIDYIKVTTLR